MADRGVTFSTEARARFPTLGEDFDAFERHLAEYDSRFVTEVTPETPVRDDEELADRDTVRVISASAIAQGLPLSRTTVHAVNTDLRPMLFLSVRAHFEVTGMLAQALVWTRKSRASKEPLAGFSKALDKLFASTRYGLTTLDPEVAAVVEGFNVMTLVDAVDKVLVTLSAGSEDLGGMFRDGYEWISEFCHPANLYARLGIQAPGPRRVMHFFRDRRLEEHEVGSALDAANISQTMFFHIHSETSALLAEWRP